MSSLGEVNYFFWGEIMQSVRGIFISQKQYINDLLKKFDMDICNATEISMNEGEKFFKKDGTPKVNSSTFRSLIKSILCICSSRQDIMYVMCIFFDICKLFHKLIRRKN